MQINIIYRYFIWRAVSEECCIILAAWKTLELVGMCIGITACLFFLLKKFMFLDHITANVHL